MSNSAQSSISPKSTRVLLSIRPEFADAISRGEKRYEFRRSIFARHVTTIVLYATAPISLVIGEFDVRSVTKAPVSELWARTRWHAGIDAARFFRYFEGKAEGYAIEVGDYRAYDQPYCPLLEHGLRPPQSFAYLD